MFRRLLSKHLTVSSAAGVRRSQHPGPGDSTMVDDFPCMNSTESKKCTDDKDDAAFAVLVVSLPQFETGEKKRCENQQDEL